MSKIILGIKDDNRPMHVLGFEGNYSIESVWEENLFLSSFHYYDTGRVKITLENTGEAVEFDSSKGALNYIYGCGRSGYKKELAALSIFEKALGIKKDSKSPALTKVISSGPATIAFWDDGTKTVVKCQEGDTYDAEKGILYAVLRKCISDNKDYHNFLTEMDRFKTFVEEMKMKEECE